MRMIDEDEVGLKTENQKTLDTSNSLHRKKIRSTASAGKGLDSQFCHYWERLTRESAGAPRLKVFKKPRFLMSGTLIFSHNSQNMTHFVTKFGMSKFCVVP